MHTLVNALTATLEGLMVFLATCFVAMLIMAAFGAVSVTELRIALLESVAAIVVWARYFRRPA